MSSLVPPLQEAMALLRQEQWQQAARLLAELLQHEGLPPGYPARDLVSAARGLLTLLPQPRIALALDCLGRARDVLTAIPPGQARLW